MRIASCGSDSYRSQISKSTEDRCETSILLFDLHVKFDYA
jgi:hypothetical protein